MPKGLIAGMGALLVFAVLILVFGPGGAGSAAFTSDEMLAAPSVLPLALQEAYGGTTVLSTFVNIAGLAALIASFFSIIYAYSRQLFALSRAGYLPRFLSVTGSRRTPWVALVVPAVIGFLLSLTGAGATLLNAAVFGAAISYVLMTLSHIVLRSREPNLERPYRTPGGVITSGIACGLAVLAVIATFIVDRNAAFIMLGVYVLVYRLLPPLQPPPPRGPGAGGGVRHDREGRIRAGLKLERSKKKWTLRRSKVASTSKRSRTR